MRRGRIHLHFRNVMRAASIDGGDDPPVADAALDAVVADWIGAPGQGGQLDYYARKAGERGRMHRHAQATVRACLWAGIAIAACVALFQGALGAGNARWLVAAMQGRHGMPPPHTLAALAHPRDAR